ncbi:flagellar basal body P-ring formation chaperone FlgA [Alsobacter sp. KACC 23698]|uniref:Flagellar basal body P-ring formation chaperone FlgA n=1 Tax=Alsobacter sp. KACC 23698 TaxID=3149229 RepID=A0AAU7JAQ6_9HYPH
MAIVTLMRAAGLAGLALLAALEAAVPAGAQSAPKPALRGDVVVMRDVVTLGDLVERAGAAAASPVFRAPPLGKAGTIQAIRVIEAARSAGLSVDPGTVSQIVVSRASRRAPKAEIEAVVSQALTDRYGLDRPDVALALEAGEQAVHLEPDALGPLKVSELVYDPRSRRVEAVLTVAGSASLTLKPLRVLGQTVDMVSVPVLQKTVQRGDSVTAADVTVERRPRADYPTAGFVDPSMLVGRIARNAMQAGSAVRETDVVKQEIVEKNATVTVLYETPGIALAMRGKALEAGGVGDTVLVMNPQSKRTLSATAISPGVVKVIMAVPGRLAENGAAQVVR